MKLYLDVFQNKCSRCVLGKLHNL